MKRIYLLMLISVLPFMQLSAQSFTVFINNGNTVKYPAELVTSIDYASYQDGIVVFFNTGGGEFIPKNVVDSIIFYEDERDCEIMSGTPKVDVQYQSAYETVNRDVSESAFLRFLIVRGDYPLSKITLSMGDQQMDCIPEGKEKDVCYLWGTFGLDIEGKKLLTVTATDENGQEASTGIWLNTIPWPLAPTSVPDCFVYYPNSWFHFWKYEKDIAEGKACWWNVTDYDHATGIATISITEENETPTYLKLRRNHVTGALEKVDGSTYYNLTDRTKDLHFITGYTTKEPSSLLGDMEDKITYKDVGDGVYSVTASEVYHQNKNDRYGWGWDLYNTYRTDVGYTGTSWTSYDNQAGPSASFGYHDNLLEYYIEYPDGTYLYKKADLPPAPVITGVTKSSSAKNLYTMLGDRYDFPEYTFEFSGTTDLIDFRLWTYDTDTKTFVYGPPPGTFTELTFHYNDRYQKVPDLHYNISASSRVIDIRSSGGFDGQYQYGPHFMVLTARNPAGCGAASNIFYYAINEYGSLMEYGFDDGSSSNAPMRGTAKSDDSVLNEDVIRARDMLLEQLNSQYNLKIPAGKK